MFKRDCYIKIVDTHGNFRFGFIADTKERGSVLLIDLTEEGLSKIHFDKEYIQNVPDAIYTYQQIGDFNKELSEIEKKMLPLLAENKSSTEIGQAMGLAPGTIRSHCRDMKNKFQLDTREQLFVYAQGIMEIMAENGHNQDK